MLYYAKIMDDQTKECMVINQIEAQRKGWEKLDIEVAYNGKFYISGYAPEKPDADLQKEVRAVRNQYLQQYDYTQLIDAPFDEQTKAQYADYRQYLRDYTNEEDWWMQNPKTYAEWKNSNYENR